MTALAVDVRGLTKHYGLLMAVDHVSLSIPHGQVYGFLGPNGSGKTTTIRMICGLITPDAGSGTCLGLELLKDQDKIKRRVGYMTQKFSYWEDLTVRENLLFVADMFELDRPRARVDAMLEKMGLADRSTQLAGSLSGGWKQRLALAACILHEPELLLLDEPTAGVDPQARREFWDQIHALAAEGLTVLVSTHYMDEAERCHAIIYIAYGRIVVQGTVQEVIAQAGLTTWKVTGRDVMGIMQALKDHPAVTTAAPFGGAVHICGRDAALLDKAIAPYRAQKGTVWQQEEPSLEDAFIYYMAQRQEEGGTWDA